MFDPSSFANPTPLAHADTSRDVLPRGGTSQQLQLKGSAAVVEDYKVVAIHLRRGFPQMESFRITASRVARGKPWSTLCKKSHGIPSSPRAADVAKFRLLTGHDCLCAHLFRFNLVTSPICVLCDTGQDMTAAHLDQCSALNDLNCIVKGIGEPVA
ncbi:uncharacterized protein TNCV_244381 [Trichonephila clavipes]|uniref:Uncharacterized protein n=1 Tax=Trichonephila clavipes TaxID=2585209 RepID=A0A8X6RSC8_TRICX|nr:uncharacterized protein TNCV_244381 [Trichonephila clavipes]